MPTPSAGCPTGAWLPWIELPENVSGPVTYEKATPVDERSVAQKRPLSWMWLPVMSTLAPSYLTSRASALSVSSLSRKVAFVTWSSSTPQLLPGTVRPSSRTPELSRTSRPASPGVAEPVVTVRPRRVALPTQAISIGVVTTAPDPPATLRSERVQDAPG